jgi:hypothetical protein
VDFKSISGGEYLLSHNGTLQRVSQSAAPLLGLDTQQFPSGFEKWRSSLDHLHGMQLLDALTEPNNATACIQTLPTADLHRYLFDIGLEDSDRLLALTSSEQVRQLLDIEVWNKSELSIQRVDLWLHTLMRAGHDVLYQRMLDLDDQVLTWIVKQNTYAFVVEDPESFDPPDVEHVMAAEQRLCICFPREDAIDLPSKVFLDRCMRDTPEFCIYLLLASDAALNSQLEEEAYHWRSIRMSELGFIDYYEALAIYADPPGDWQRALPPQRIFEDDVPSKTWLIQVIGSSQRLDRAFAALSWSEALIVTELVGYVANMMMSADRIELWDDQAKEQILHRLRAGLHLALEILNGAEAHAESDAKILSQHHLNYLFRLGYQAMVKSVAPIRRVKDHLVIGDDLVGALSDLPHLKPWAQALLSKHPHTLNGQPLYTQAECTLALQTSQLIEDLYHVSVKRQQGWSLETHAYLIELIKDQQIGLGAQHIAALAKDFMDLKQDGPIPKDCLSEFHILCFADGKLRSEIREYAIKWWTNEGGKQPLAILALLKELSEQMAHLDAQQINAQFVSIVWTIT